VNLLICGDDAVGVLDIEDGGTYMSALPSQYAFDSAPALGSSQRIRAFGATWHRNTGILIACHERIGILDQGLRHSGFLDISPLWFMTHAIAVRDDILYTCNSRIDVVGEHNLRSGHERFLNVQDCEVVPNPQGLKPLKSGYEHDSCHPNAVVVSQDSVFVLVHPEILNGVSSEVRQFDRRSLAWISTVKIDERPNGTFYAHDLAFANNVWLWCDTYRCQVRASDGRESARLGDCNYFLRGLAVGREDIYVGLVTRRDLKLCRAFVVRLDLASYVEIGRIEIPFREVCTIRIVDGYDSAHPGVVPAPLQLDILNNA
jgi:hypothetical protein